MSPPPPPPGYLGDHVLATEDILYKGSLDNFNIVKLRQGSGKDRQGMALEVLKLKPLSRAFTTDGCHHPPPPPSLNEWLDAPVRGQVR